jgi:hypothetical protein
MTVWTFGSGGGGRGAPQPASNVDIRSTTNLGWQMTRERPGANTLVDRFLANHCHFAGQVDRSALPPTTDVPSWDRHCIKTGRICSQNVTIPRQWCRKILGIPPLSTEFKSLHPHQLVKVIVNPASARRRSAARPKASTAYRTARDQPVRDIGCYFVDT